MCTQKCGGVCFLKYYFKRRKLSKPDTYPRFAKLAKKIVSHGLLKNFVFLNWRIMKPHLSFLNVFIGCLSRTWVHFAILEMMFQCQDKRVKIAFFCDPKNSKLVHFLKINFPYPGNSNFLEI